MDYTTILLFLILVTVAVDRILERLSLGDKKKARAFPRCLHCGKGGIKLPSNGIARPDEVEFTLQKYRLPDVVVTKFICETGCSYIWFIPQIADMPKHVIRTERIR